MTAKRRSALSDLQIAFNFDVPPAAAHEGDLAGLDAIVSASVSRMLREDTRPRTEIAAHASRLLGKQISKSMLDVYASEAHVEHNVPASRWLAIVAATGNFAVADAIMKHIGCRLLSGDEIKAAELGHLQAERDAIDARMKELRTETRPMKRGRR